jgi:hypothetical protein
MRQQLASGVRQHHSIRCPFEQLDVKPLFKRLDLSAQRGLADVQPLGGACQMPGLSDRRKCS